MNGPDTEKERDLGLQEMQLFKGCEEVVRALDDQRGTERSEVPDESLEGDIEIFNMLILDKDNHD